MILDHFMGSPRDVQREALLKIEESWNDYDVFIIVAPTATGKSKIAHCIAEWLGEGDIITPTNILLQQYREGFPGFPSMMKADLYKCTNDKIGMSCQSINKRSRFCGNCHYSKDRAKVMFSRKSIMNYYMYMATHRFIPGRHNRKPANTLIIDEAHNLIPTLQDLNIETLWQKDYNYPDTLRTYGEVHDWANQSHKLALKKISLLEKLRIDMNSEFPEYMINRTFKHYRNKMEDCIEMKPVNIKHVKTRLWRNNIQKLVLLSATIGRKDIQELGLDNKRVLYINCKSPIPIENRPIIYRNVASLTNASMNENVPIICKEIDNILEKHRGEKGLIHVTYSMALLLRKYLRNDRLIFHDNTNKISRYNQFINSTTDKVLVASGLYEGVDLPGDLGRFQVIAKIPWPSLEDVAVEYKAELDPEWYLWETIKPLIQASGRVCRTPTDYGITYILDGTFGKLYKKELLPSWWVESIKEERVNA